MRLEVSRKADLATRALLQLAGSSDRQKSVELAERLETTPGFLTQVLAPLVKMGWVRSAPGPTGGYSVAVPLDGLSVLDVIEAVEGPTDSDRCVLEPRPCSTGLCALHQPWSTARARLLSELGSTKMSTLAATLPKGAT